MALPDYTMRQLLESGAHFGHRTQRWNPNMAPFIYGSRNDIHIIDLTQTVPLLHQALVAILDHLEDAFWLEEALKKYGARHADYGVTEERYDWFGECLLATLAEIKGPTWTPQLAAAWADAYRVISGLMKAGAMARK